MRVELTDISPVKKSLNIQIDADEIARERDKLVRGYAAKARIPGFRPGKAPLAVVRQRFAKEIDEELRDRLISHYHHEATHEKHVHPIGDPVLDEMGDLNEVGEGKPFEFKTTFEVLPKIELQDYKGIEVRRPKVVVADEDVDKALEELRESRATLVAEEGRTAMTGDVVVVDVHGEPAGGEPFDRERTMIEVGATDNLPAFNDSIEGVSAGDVREFPVDYPNDFPAEHLSGRTVTYRLTVHEVKRREVPDLDDEFAKDLGEFDDMAALRARVREDLASHRGREADRAVRQAVLDKVLLANPVVLPDGLVDAEIRSRLEDLVRQLVMQGIDPEKAELDWKDLRQRQEEPARKAVHARLILDAVALAESLAVTPKEVEERIAREAAASGRSVAEIKQRINGDAGVQVLRHQMVREKSLDLLTSVANIQNEE